ncbi:MAG: hypothetical protein KAH31_04530 [Candidatus Sabulitectum sp.]|nr:hypothetical protein [Candidatus Sabulitectum sp.]
MTDRFYSRMFLLAALWNVIATVAGLAFYQFQLQLFFGSEAYTNCFYQALFYRIAITAVLIFGIGYYMVSRQITANRGIVWLGALGKLSLFCAFTCFFISGKVTAIAFVLALGDLVWATLFLMFLFQTRDRIQYSTK